jgi:hypothetical protein
VLAVLIASRIAKRFRSTSQPTWQHVPGIDSAQQFVACSSLSLGICTLSQSQHLHDEQVPAGSLTSSSSASRPAPSRRLRLKPFLMASSSSLICLDSCASAQRACAASRLDSSSLPSVASASRSSCRGAGGRAAVTVGGSGRQQEKRGGSRGHLRAG